MVALALRRWPDDDRRALLVEKNLVDIGGAVSVAWRKSLQKMRGEGACGARLAKLPCDLQRVLPSVSAKWSSLANLLNATSI